MKKFFKWLAIIIVLIFACIGFAFTGVFAAMKLGLTKTVGVVDTQNDFWQNWKTRKPGTTFKDIPQAGEWAQSDEWAALSLAIQKDKSAILGASYTAGVEPRLIVAEIVSEQLRLFTSERDIFKQVFQPLKVLGTQTQFSLGVTGVKEETAHEIEDRLADPMSPFYPGAQYAHLLDYPTVPTGDDRTARFSDEHNHYYSYLYTALYLREIMSQWRNAGFDISARPEILSTLFNLGFEKSVPKADPQVGGAPITVNNVTYSFGGLAGEFYYSNELVKDFPRTN